MFLRPALLAVAAGSISVLASCIPHNMTYDYIVVGGGTSGLVVATRLTEDPDVRVLVVEAGADKSADPLVLTPALGTSTVGNPDYDWAFRSTPQVSLASIKSNSRQANPPSLASSTVSSASPAGSSSAAHPVSTSWS